jgi:hypothetical protein
VAEAFLTLDPANVEDEKVLDLLSANTKYVTVDLAAYAPLRDAAIREGLLK